MELFVFLCSLIIFVSFALMPLARRAGAPILLIALLIGMLLGEDGPGRIQFSNFNFAFDLGSVALAVILFAGGLETGRSVFRSAGAPASLLATIGVLITAGITGVAACLFMGLPWQVGLLLGAAVASTDAAATFLLVQQSGIALRQRLKDTLLLESGLNDPMAIFLTVSLTTLVASIQTNAPADLPGMALFLLMQAGIGILGGVLGGRLLARILDRLFLPMGTYPIMTLAGALVIFTGVSLVGGSGFLAAYLAGVSFKAKLKRPIDRIVDFNEAFQWLCQMVLFLTLGLLVTPSALLNDIWPAIGCAAVLMLIARPLAVFASVGWMGFSFRENVFLSWVGLRGAVPILLAIYPVIAPGPISVGFFNVVFVIVTISLTIQGWTIAPTAGLLRLGPEAQTKETTDT
ncbi:potassium/proton antiporter [Hyphomonas sp. UBA4494]|uniref:potassium/proton antiporter n=1 Tax=Hyphomonas sp. UBA4494 TaxID=1946631 RepID=UPI0025B97DE9|nr:potassium/proton antiporter [Hyphomonas sp. UBA4494]